MRVLRHVIRGCGYVEGYGSHPGSAVLWLFVVMGVAAGAERGWRGALFGGVVMLAVFGPMYLWGAYDRSVSADRKARLATLAPTPSTNNTSQKEGA